MTRRCTHMELFGSTSRTSTHPSSPITRIGGPGKPTRFEHLGNKLPYPAKPHAAIGALPGYKIQAMGRSGPPGPGAGPQHQEAVRPRQGEAAQESNHPTRSHAPQSSIPPRQDIQALLVRAEAVHARSCFDLRAVSHSRELFGRATR